MSSKRHRMSRDEEKALRHIRKHGDDRLLNTKRWYPVKVSLWRAGLIERRPGDWVWVPVEDKH